MLNMLSDPSLEECLFQGKVGVLPTDTLYGLVCRAADEAAVTRLYGLKSRERKPGTVVAANMDQLVSLGLKARYLKAVEKFWPDAVSIIVPCGPELSYLDKGLRTVAVRITADKILNTLINSVGPLLTSSANLPGKPPANNIQEAQSYFGESLDFYVDGGDLSGREPSTLIRIVDDAIEVLRLGAAKIDEMGNIR